MAWHLADPLAVSAWLIYQCKWQPGLGLFLLVTPKPQSHISLQHLIRKNRRVFLAARARFSDQDGRGAKCRRSKSAWCLWSTWWCLKRPTVPRAAPPVPSETFFQRKAQGSGRGNRVARSFCEGTQSFSREAKTKSPKSGFRIPLTHGHWMS